MTPSALANELFKSHDRVKISGIAPGNCKHGEVIPEFHRIAEASQGLLRMEEIGTSLEHRSINMLTCGRGDKKVLLWSQMHGDEPTATLALLDIFNLLATEGTSHKWTAEMLDSVTIYAIPMLNPDGAERVQRRTASNIDMNRDARALVTPEANILRNLQRRLKPRFGFNLHDQELSSVGTSNEVTAIALLAPALDEKRTTPLVRLRAMRIAAYISRMLGHFARGHVARYNDTFEPRAFGDNMQAWGTSTVLIESGHWPNDKEKQFIRKLNYITMLGAFHSIASGSYQDVDIDHYHDLPENGKRIFDILIKDLVIEHPAGVHHSADIGLMVLPSAIGQLCVTVKDIGDLSIMAGLTEIEGGLRRATVDYLRLDAVFPLKELLDKLQLYYPGV